MFFAFERSALGAAAFLACACAGAQTMATQPDAMLREITVTGTVPGDMGGAVPVLDLRGNALLLKSQGTLGQTLDGQPGVSSTYFGPNASRPVIRGQDGDRIRIMQNGGAAPDASGLSYDHAVPVDALVTERIEVLRGPAALRYGGSAVGGVVNVIDNRIPAEPIGGFGGRADLGYGTGNSEKTGGVLVEGGNDRYALHVDAFSRDSGDVAVPIALPCTASGTFAVQRRMCNSAARSNGGAVGGTLFFDQGWLGASASTYRSDYGTVAEDDVKIGMQSNRYALEGRWNLPAGGFFTALHGKFNHTDYQHTEYEGGVPGTTFTNQGNDLRLEAAHRAIAGWQGTLGLQSESTHFDAEGEEAFAPRSRAGVTALFIEEALPTAWGRLSLGARAEHASVRSLGSSTPDMARFAIGERDFNPHSAALGVLYRLDPQWQLMANLAYTERAPKDYELFANGPHIATAAWEVGDPTLGKEKSLGLDAGAQWASGPHNARFSAYISRFRNYIGLTATGGTRDPDGTPGTGSADALAEYLYQGVRARFTGFEASGNWRLMGAGAGEGAATLDLQWRADLVRAVNADTGEALPRIAPARAGATLAWGRGPWGGSLGFDAVAAQHHVPAQGERETAGHTLWNAALTYGQKAGSAHLDWYARIDNITNRLAYSASSILTTTAFPNAPLPGRTLRLGVRVTF